MAVSEEYRGMSDLLRFDAQSSDAQSLFHWVSDMCSDSLSLCCLTHHQWRFLDALISLPGKDILYHYKISHCITKTKYFKNVFYAWNVLVPCKSDAPCLTSARALLLSLVATVVVQEIENSPRSRRTYSLAWQSDEFVSFSIQGAKA